MKEITKFKKKYLKKLDKELEDVSGKNLGCVWNRIDEAITKLFLNRVDEAINKAYKIGKNEKTIQNIQTTD